MPVPMLLHSSGTSNFQPHHHRKRFVATTNTEDLTGPDHDKNPFIPCPKSSFRSFSKISWCPLMSAVFH